MIQNNQSRARTFIYNSLLLTLSAVLMRAVGVAYNVYVSNRVGAEVMGLYSLVTNVWGFALTLATSGVNLAATRCVAEAGEKKSEIRVAMRKCIVYSLSFGISAAFLLFVLAKPISALWLSDSRAIVPLRIMSVSLPVISISSALSGYFSAVRRVWKSAAVQVTEQAIKIFGVAALLTPLMPLGIEYACIAIVLGGAIAEILSFLLYALFYSLEKRKLKGIDISRIDSRKLNRKIFSIALPVAFSTYIRSGLTTVEHVLIPLGLRESGLDAAEALESYGVLSGMVLPVVLFPYALIHSFTGLLVPEVSGGIAAGEKRHIEYIASPDLNDKTLLIVDPMLATGESMELAWKAFLTKGTPSKLHIACVIASQQGVDHLAKLFPEDDVTLWCATIDPELNERSYIVPGLGDAGDLAYGSKLD